MERLVCLSCDLIVEHSPECGPVESVPCPNSGVLHPRVFMIPISEHEYQEWQARHPNNFSPFIANLPPAKSNRRRAYRFEVVSDCGLRVTLLIDGGQFPAAPLDVSLNGLLVATPTETPELAVDTPLQVRLEMDGLEVILAAVTKRVLDGQYGLFFPETMDGAKLAPPAVYAQILAKLEDKLRLAHMPW